MKRTAFIFLCIIALVLGACGAPALATSTAPAAQTTSGVTFATSAGPGSVLRLATTTSTADSGLLDAILPAFEATCACRVDVVAVGTGQAIEIGSRGDADVLLVHARKAEDQFVADGHARERFDVMYNDFIIVGPKTDPAHIRALGSSADAFRAIMEARALFASRGDKSGTNTNELSIWTAIKVTPTKDMAWYNAIGQGMGETLTFANERGAYTLSDRGTYLSMIDRLPNLTILFGGQTLADNKDKGLLNAYGVMAVNPDKHPGVNYDLAMQFIHWITSVATQKVIGAYGVDKFGQPLFYPSSAEYKSATP